MMTPSTMQCLQIVQNLLDDIEIRCRRMGKTMDIGIHFANYLQSSFPKSIVFRRRRRRRRKEEEKEEEGKKKKESSATN